LVDDELVRAIRSESSLAIQYWWGVQVETVWRWRKAFGVGRYNEGSAKLRVDLNEKLANRTRGKKLPPDQVERRRRTARELNLGQHLAVARACREGLWTRKELRLLGKMPDAEVAEQIGRTVNAVRIKREKHGIPNPIGHGWTEEELAMLGTAPDEEVAARTGRTPGAVWQKRCLLGIRIFRDRRRKG
jgi:hypothetical protein